MWEKSRALSLSNYTLKPVFSCVLRNPHHAGLAYKSCATKALYKSTFTLIEKLMCRCGRSMCFFSGEWYVYDSPGGLFAVNWTSARLPHFITSSTTCRRRYSNAWRHQGDPAPTLRVAVSNTFWQRPVNTDRPRGDLENFIYELVSLSLSLAVVTRFYYYHIKTHVH